MQTIIILASNSITLLHFVSKFWRKMTGPLPTEILDPHPNRHWFNKIFADKMYWKMQEKNHTRHRIREGTPPVQLFSLYSHHLVTPPSPTGPNAGLATFTIRINILVGSNRVYININLLLPFLFSVVSPHVLPGLVRRDQVIFRIAGHF